MSVTSPGLRHGDTDDVVGGARAHAIDRGSSTLHRIIDTDATLHTTIARLALGAVMLPHALQKTAGWFGGYGFSPAYQAFTGVGIPGPIAALAIFGELFGAVCLILGALTRLGALVIVAIMLGAIALVHFPNGFFMNWAVEPRGEGFEFHLLAIGLGLVCLLAGGGRVSIDRLLMRWRPAEGGAISPALST
jgi:putative oxidoreductase